LDYQLVSKKNIKSIYMKNIIKVSFAAVLILTGISCEKAVDKNPTHAATLENAFVTLNDFETS